MSKDTKHIEKPLTSEDFIKMKCLFYEEPQNEDLFNPMTKVLRMTQIMGIFIRLEQRLIDFKEKHPKKDVGQEERILELLLVNHNYLYRIWDLLHHQQSLIKSLELDLIQTKVELAVTKKDFESTSKLLNNLN